MARDLYTFVVATSPHITLVSWKAVINDLLTYNLSTISLMNDIKSFRARKKKPSSKELEAVISVICDLFYSGKKSH